MLLFIYIKQYLIYIYKNKQNCPCILKKKKVNYVIDYQEYDYQNEHDGWTDRPHNDQVLNIYTIMNTHLRIPKWLEGGRAENVLKNKSV